MFREDENLLSPEGTELETEMLQTDIQRFLAILAFSLLPIFMLVQAIPVVSQEKEAVIKEYQRPVEAQDRRIIPVREESTPLKNEAPKEVRQEARIEIRREETQIEQKPAAGKQEHPMTKPDVIKDIQRPVAVQDRRTIPVREESVPLKKEVPKGEKGLYVAFESDRVFVDLLEDRKVDLLISLPALNQSFRVYRQDGKITFDAGVAMGSLDLWEIREVMVPAEIRDAFRKWTTLASREKMFVVGLPPELSRQIRDRQAQGGRILIGQQGTVRPGKHEE